MKVPSMQDVLTYDHYEHSPESFDFSEPQNPTLCFTLPLTWTVSCH
jgi:hypothetical protein